jgi:hypothetical protein
MIPEDGTKAEFKRAVLDFSAGLRPEVGGYYLLFYGNGLENQWLEKVQVKVFSRGVVMLEYGNKLSQTMSLQAWLEMAYLKIIQPDDP